MSDETPVDPYTLEHNLCDSLAKALMEEERYFRLHGSALSYQASAALERYRAMRARENPIDGN